MPATLSQVKKFNQKVVRIPQYAECRLRMFEYILCLIVCLARGYLAKSKYD